MDENKEWEQVNAKKKDEGKVSAKEKGNCEKSEKNKKKMTKGGNKNISNGKKIINLKK